MSTEEGTTGRASRRIDKVLAEDYLDGLRQGSLEQVRALRAEAEQVEVDLSYVRRLVQGRIDLLRAQALRRGDGGTDLVATLVKILADEPRDPARGLGRYSPLQPSAVDQHRRRVESLVADVDLSDVTTRSDEQVAEALQILADEERELSAERRAVQAVMDTCSAEITRRYRDGEADVAALLGAVGRSEG